MNSDPSDKLNLSDPETTAPVPVFNCIVHLRPVGGGIEARVANLPGLTCSAASEREALSKLIPAFKQRISQLLADDKPVPWIEPPSPAGPDDQTRLVPVHL